MHIIMDEAFWVAISFVIFCGLAYFPFKKFVLVGLSKKILEVKSSVESSDSAVREAKFLLLKLKCQHEDLLIKYQTSMMEAKAEALRIIHASKIETDHVVAQIKQSAEQRITSLKGDITQTIYAMVINKICDNAKKEIPNQQINVTNTTIQIKKSLHLL